MQEVLEVQEVQILEVAAKRPQEDAQQSDTKRIRREEEVEVDIGDNVQSRFDEVLQSPSFASSLSEGGGQRKSAAPLRIQGD